jgi:hypothetical protein
MILMAHVRRDVIASVKARFPEESWERVPALLETYGVESYEQERERVQLALGVQPEDPGSKQDAWPQ